ncbi:MAG: hypothetical protein WCQ32_03380 [bacterium]
MKILAALEQAPHWALANIDLTPRVEDLDLPKQDHFLFGHKVQLDAVQKQDLDLSVKRQAILDWQEAARDLALRFTEKGFPKPVIVPKELFDTVCKKCKLIRLENMDEKGSLHLFFLNIDNFFFIKVFEHVSPCMTKANVLGDNYLRHWWNPGWGGWVGKPIYFELNDNPSFWGKGASDPYSIGLAFDSGYLLKLDTQQAKHNFDSFMEEYNDPYYLYMLAMKDQNFITMGSKMEMSNTFAVFPELPPEFQMLLVNLKKTFPHWPVYTAADPDFFSLVQEGVDVRIYTKKRFAEFADIFSQVVEISENIKNKQEEWQKKFLDECAEQGISPTGTHTFLSEEDVAKAVQIEKDPIFYLPVELTHKHVKYKFAVVYGQCGESPYEKAAIEDLKNISYETFMGSAAN